MQRSALRSASSRFTLRAHSRWKPPCRSSISGTNSPRPIPIPPPCGSASGLRKKAWTCAGGRSCSGHFRQPGLDHLAVQSLPRQGALYVARHGAHYGGRRSDAVWPEPFPQNSLSAARLALALEESQRPDFSRAVYLAEFAHGRRIDEAATLAAILVGLGLDAPVLMARAGGAPVKEALKANVAEAQALGVFFWRPLVHHPGTANCSGASTGWRRRSIGRRADNGVHADRNRTLCAPYRAG